MTLEDAIFTAVPVTVNVTNPETPFGAVQMFRTTGAQGPEGPQGPPGPEGPQGPPGSGGDASTGITNSSLTRLVEGQDYVDVTFDTPQTDDTWIFMECAVLNTTDPTPLNIWPGIITSKTASGFRRQLNAAPDSPNYYLSWAVTGTTTDVPVTGGDRITTTGDRRVTDSGDARITTGTTTSFSERATTTGELRAVDSGEIRETTT